MLTNANYFHCDYREIGCHNEYPRYKKYKKEIEKIRKNRNKEKIYFDYFGDKGR